MTSEVFASGNKPSLVSTAQYKRIYKLLSYYTKLKIAAYAINLRTIFEFDNIMLYIKVRLGPGWPGGGDRGAIIF